MFRLILPLILCFLFVGCASYGAKIDANAVQQIEKGKTTENQVYALLGNPMSVGIAPDGQKFLMYMYTKSQAKASTFIPVVGLLAGGADTTSQTLQVWINANGVVSNYAFNDTQTELKTGVL
ncbi:outer membrane protein assembly factor BamE domain-containing protein [Oceanisphaera pacifica]|uniref:Outer membrane protein assembly factor BamE n=1 Tax=Oceanisphaera pacifica TaxID=2818389 RepID=A0ABS3NK19_9GAMM|nr:outer membrane protein assembly factor BamE [Oceanisphaera pacifica]MBO1520635.1 outer membrane protein assembly factor BamE [Oceanisphaera pacifica]